MPVTYSPLRYPGGKAALAPKVKELMQCNGLMDGHYVEPFAGGCGLALDALYSLHAKYLHLNDLDPVVYNFWQACLESNADLVQLVQDTEVTIDEWFQQREVFRSNDFSDPVKMAFATLFLNRTNRSGILLGGVIGGLDQSGPYKLDARFNKAELVKKLKQIGSYSHRIKVYNLDAKAFVADVCQEMPSNTLIYLDPPYIVKGRDLYKNYFKVWDHATLAELVKALSGRHWIVSYDDVPQIEDLYAGLRLERYCLNYSARNYSKGGEVMIYSDSLCLPPGWNVCRPISDSDFLPPEVIKLCEGNQISLIAAWRMYRGLSQAQFSSIIKVPMSAVQRLERVGAYPRKTTVEKIAEALNIKPEQLAM